MKITYHKDRDRFRFIIPPAYTGTGKREVRYFDTQVEAELARREVLGRGGPPVSKVSDSQRAALVLAEKLGISENQILDAVKHYQKTVLSLEKAGATLKEACEAYYASHVEKENHRVTLSKYRSTLNRLREDLGNSLPLVEVTKDMILKVFFKRFKDSGTRMAQWSNVRAFLNWAVKEKYLSVSPLANEEPVGTREAKKEILSVEDFRRILFACQEPRFRRLMPYFVLGGLAGVRRCEMISSTSATNDPRIEWTDILWEQNRIKIRQEVAKETPAKDRRRNIPLELAAREWLQVSGIKDKGPILDFSQSTLQREKAMLLDKLKIEDIPENALRNSYASYGTACRSPGDVARAMGDLESTVRQYYVDLVDDKVTGEAWFNIRPSMERKILPMTVTG